MTKKMRKHNMRALREVYLGNATPVMVDATILVTTPAGYAAFSSNDLDLFSKEDLQAAALKAIKEYEEVQ